MSKSDIQPTAEELKGVKRSTVDDAEHIKKPKSSNSVAAILEEALNGAEEHEDEEEEKNLDKEDLGEEEEGEEDFDDEEEEGEEIEISDEDA